MAKGVKARVKVPKTAAAGESVTLKTLISHKMKVGCEKIVMVIKFPNQSLTGSHVPSMEIQ